MSKHLIEELTGVGRIYSGEQLLRTTHYQLSVWQNDDPPAEHGGPGGVAIEGQIDVTGIGEAIVLAGPDTLTLFLEDGRSLPFALTSTRGRLVGRGALRSAPS